MLAGKWTGLSRYSVGVNQNLRRDLEATLDVLVVLFLPKQFVDD